MADQFLPRAVCYLWDRGLLTLHAVTDILIGLSYVAISTTLVVLVMRARRDIPFQWIFIAFGAFIVACGATHLMEVWTLWSPAYWTAGGVKAVTALASVATALVLPPLVPKALELIRTNKLREQLFTERSARVDAEAANRAKDEFLATLSHELRTPLNAVFGWARLLRSGSVAPDQVAKALETIERNAQAQVQLIEDLLDVSRIVTGKMRLDVRMLDLRIVIRGAVDSLAPAITAKRIRLEEHVDSAVGPVVGDADRLQQVLWNLLVNAVKYTPAEGRITLDVRRVDGHAEIAVRDSGRGLGIGLSLVRHLVELHGGEVRAESAGSGQGTAITVRLPIAPAVSTPESRWRMPLAVPAGSVPSLRGRRVLVVDDDPDSLDLARAALMRHGADVRTETSAVSASTTLATWPPDVLLCDIEMPGEDGHSFIRRLRDSGHKMPAAALTAYGRGEDRLRALGAGYDVHITKPVDPDTLAAIVGELAEGKSKR